MIRLCTGIRQPHTTQHVHLNEAISGEEHCIDEFYERHITVNSDYTDVQSVVKQLMSNDVNHAIYNQSLQQEVFIRYATWLEKEKGVAADLQRDAFTEAIQSRLTRDYGGRFVYLNYCIYECSYRRES